MSILAIIPARGGSKRIPRKNIKDFLGKPVIAYSIQAALESGIFDEVMVSTDDEEIAAVARQYGASVPFMRSPEASCDTAVDNMVMDEVLREYEKRGKTFEYMAFIYPCAPFVTAQKLRDIVASLQNSDADQATVITPYSSSPWRAYVVRDGKLEWHYPEYRLVRSQELEPLYHDCGQYYAYRVESYKKKLKNPKRAFTIVSENETQDIDSQEDWEMAELKYRRFILGEK